MLPCLERLAAACRRGMCNAWLCRLAVSPLHQQPSRFEVTAHAHCFLPCSRSALDKVQPRAVSYEEQVSAIREQLAALYESQVGWGVLGSRDVEGA